MKVSKYKIGCLVARSANDTIAEAKKYKKAKELYSHLVFEGECSCLFSDTNVGKSIFAVQMGAHIAKYGKTVLYFDFELSDTQFMQRYSLDNDNEESEDNEENVENAKKTESTESATQAESETDSVFPERFIRLEVAAGQEVSTEFIISDIEQAGVELNADVLIIDNLSWLVMDSESGELANNLMKSIKTMQKMHKWTIIVVAHTPKRNDITPISLNDLAGSRQLANFFDAVYALGRNVTKLQQRYLKQLKVRAEQITYTANNVKVFNIEKVDNMLQFVPQGYSTEYKMLRSEADLKADLYAKSVRDMAKQGISVKEIARMNGETEARIQKILRA